MTDGGAAPAAHPIQVAAAEDERTCPCGGGTASGRAALQLSRGFRGISSPEGLRYSTVLLTAAPSCVGRLCRSRGTQQTGSTSVIGKPVYAGGPLRAGAGDGREGGALPHTPASPENSYMAPPHILISPENSFSEGTHRRTASVTSYKRTIHKLDYF